MSYVFFGGMRGTAWVNAFQTVLFLLVRRRSPSSSIAHGMGGFRRAMESLLASPSTAPLLTRERVSPLYFLSYTFIPLSSHRLPAHRHLLPDGEAARRTSGRRSSSIRSACWPSGCRRSSSASPPTRRRTCRRSRPSSRRARRWPTQGPALTPERRDRLRARPRGDDVILRLVEGYAPLLAGGAARRGGDGGGHGERLADPRAVDDVHRGRVRLLRRHRAASARRCRCRPAGSSSSS